MCIAKLSTISSLSGPQSTASLNKIFFLFNLIVALLPCSPVILYRGNLAARQSLARSAGQDHMISDEERHGDRDHSSISILKNTVVPAIRKRYIYTNVH